MGSKITQSLDPFDDIEYTPMTEGEMESYGEEEFLIAQKIVETLPTIEADNKVKQQFADEIVAEMECLILASEAKIKRPSIKKNLLLEAAKTRAQLEKFNCLLISSRMQSDCMKANSIINILIANKERDLLKDVIKRIDIFTGYLNNSLPSRKGKGRHNISGQNVGKYIYKRFEFHFGVPPHSGKGRRTYGNEIKSDYDRLCDLLKYIYGITISYDARTLTHEKRKSRDKKGSK